MDREDEIMINLPGWQVMWGLAFLIYLACKFVTWWDAGRPLSFRGIGYLLAWPGLDTQTFVSGKVDHVPTERDYAFAVAKTFLGCVLFFEV